jgi:hypothetical protein
VAHDAQLDGEAIDAISAGNDALGIRVDTTIEPRQDVWIAPILTVSNSEAGFELVYQGSTARIGSVVTLAPRECFAIRLRQKATVAVDRRSGGPDAAPAEPAPPTGR